MFQISSQWMLFLFDISVRSLILAAIAAAALKLFRLSDSNVHHRVWSGVLLGMLLLPVLATVLPSIPMSIPPGWGVLIDSSVETVRPPAKPSAIISGGEVSTRSKGFALRESERSAAFDRTVLSAVPRPVSSTINAGRSVPDESRSAGLVSIGIEDALRLSCCVALVVWGVVTVGFVSRFLVGLWLSAQLLNRAVRLDEPTVRRCVAGFPRKLARRLPTICESGELAVPVTVGWLRPAVVLPGEWPSWSPEKRRAIIAHEIAHVVRGDFLVSLLAELNRCLYWFHPVSWWLCGRLSDLAEEACDDAAIDCTGDRAVYARHLLEVAAVVANRCGRGVQPGLSMARESNVESRIATILDPQRPLSRHLTRRAAATISLIAVPVIASAASVRPVSASPAKTNKPIMGLERLERSANGDADVGELDDVATGAAPAQAPTVGVRGQVTDEAGTPIGNAVVRLYRTQKSDWYARRDVSTLIAEIGVDGEGRFDHRVAKDKLPPQPARPGDRAVLVAAAPDRAYSTLTANSGYWIAKDDRKSKPNLFKQKVTLKLFPTVAIRGRLLSIEGQPVAGARVSVYQVSRPDPSRLGAWIKQTAKTPPANARNLAEMYSGPVSRQSVFPAREVFQLPSDCVEPVTTDGSGVFELAGALAEDDLVVLRIQGKGITDTTVHVLAREMNTIYGRHTTNISSRGAYYGQTFDFITQPSTPVFGVVRDAETKRPLAGMAVAVSGIYGATMSQDGYIITETDDQGRYRIEGLPIPPKEASRYRRNRLVVRPGDRPYIESEMISVPIGDGVNPIEFNIELRRAVMVKGKLTNKATGDPIASAEVYYAPYSTNDHCDKYLRYADDATMMLGNRTSYYSDKDGHFEIPVIPGRGVVAARIRTGGYVTSYGAERIEAFQTKDRAQLGRALSDHLIPSLYHSLKELDVPPGEREFKLAMEVDEGMSITVRFVDPDGKPLKGVGGRGVRSDRQWHTVQEDRVVATGLAVGGIRPMFYSHETRKIRRLVRLIPEEGQSEFTVQLFPESRLQGRIVDPEGRPLADVTLEARHQNDPEIGSSRPQVQTDEDGRFDYPLPVGTSYTVYARTEKYFTVATKLDNSQPKKIDLGELVLDAESEQWSKLESKSEPVTSDLDPGAVPPGSPVRE